MFESCPFVGWDEEFDALVTKVHRKKESSRTSDLQHYGNKLKQDDFYMHILNEQSTVKTSNITVQMNQLVI